MLGKSVVRGEITRDYDGTFRTDDPAFGNAPRDGLLFLRQQEHFGRRRSIFFEAPKNHRAVLGFEDR
jgi:hypothetical protein